MVSVLLLFDWLCCFVKLKPTKAKLIATFFGSVYCISESDT